MDESYEEWAKRQPKEYHDAYKIVQAFHDKRGEEDRARELELARSMVGSYWKQYDAHFYKVLAVNGVRVTVLEVEIGDTWKTVKIVEADNPFLAREEAWKDERLSPKRITREQFFAGIKPLLELLA